MARFTSLLFAMRTLIYGCYCIQKSNYDHFDPYFDIIVFKMKRSLFPVVLNKQTQPRFLLPAIFFTCLPPEKPHDLALIPSVLECVQRWQVSWIRSIVELKKKKTKTKTAIPSWHSPFKYSCWWSSHRDVSYSAVGTLYITALTRWQLYWLVQLVKRGGISWGTVRASEFIGKRKSQFTSSIDICVTECKWVDGWYQDKVYSTPPPPNHFSPPGHAWITLSSIFIFLHLGACLQAREKGKKIQPSLVQGCH